MRVTVNGEAREISSSRIDARRVDLSLLAVDDHAHCITSLSITPRAT